MFSRGLHPNMPGMLLSGEVVAAPLAMAGALGVAFIGSLSIGVFVVSTALRQGAAGGAESEDAVNGSRDGDRDLRGGDGGVAAA